MKQLTLLFFMFSILTESVICLNSSFATLDNDGYNGAGSLNSNDEAVQEDVCSTPWPMWPWWIAVANTESNDADILKASNPQLPFDFEN